MNQLLDVFTRVSMANEGQHRKDLPAMVVSIEPEKKSELETIHHASDWVFILDEYLGADYLDRPASGRNRYHLIDYVPGDSMGKSNVYVSTNQTMEIESLVTPVLKNLMISVDEGIERGVVDSLNAISGRLVMKLSSNENQIKGALGMALARLYIGELNRLNQNMQVIILPLDAHKEWFTALPSQRMTDILAVACDVETGRRHCVCS
jgi:hypothetical protein